MKMNESCHNLSYNLESKCRAQVLIPTHGLERKQKLAICDSKKISLVS